MSSSTPTSSVGSRSARSTASASSRCRRSLRRCSRSPGPGPVTSSSVWTTVRRWCGRAPSNGSCRAVRTTRDGRVGARRRRRQHRGPTSLRSHRRVVAGLRRARGRGPRAGRVHRCRSRGRRSDPGCGSRSGAADPARRRRVAFGRMRRGRRRDRSHSLASGRRIRSAAATTVLLTTAPARADRAVRTRRPGGPLYGRCSGSSTWRFATSDGCPRPGAHHSHRSTPCSSSSPRQTSMNTAELIKSPKRSQRCPGRALQARLVVDAPPLTADCPTGTRDSVAAIMTADSSGRHFRFHKWRGT